MPLFRTAQLVESPDNLQQRIRSALPNPFVIVVEQLNKHKRALLDEGQEKSTSRGEQSANSISGDLLFDAYGTVNIQQLVDVDIQIFAIDAVADTDENWAAGLSMIVRLFLPSPQPPHRLTRAHPHHRRPRTASRSSARPTPSRPSRRTPRPQTHARDRPHRPRLRVDSGDEAADHRLRAGGLARRAPCVDL